MLKKIFYTIAGIFLTYTFLGFLVLPYIIKSQAINYVQENLNKELDIEKISFNPFLFNIDINNISLKDSGETIISFENILVDFDLMQTISNKYLNFEELTLNKPYINIQINQNKELNLLSLIPSKPNDTTQQKQQPDNELIKLKLDKFNIISGNINFSDYSFTTPLNFNLDNINYTLRDLSTLANTVASQNITITINEDSYLRYKGGLSLDALKAYGILELENFKLSSIWDSIKNQANIEIGKDLILDTKVGFALHLDGEPTIILNDTTINLKNFHITEKDNSTIISLNNFAINELNLKYPQTPNTKILATDSILQINSGKIITNSLINIEPLSAEVDYQLENVSLDIVNDILSKMMFLDIKSAFLNAKGKVVYANNNILATTDISLDKLSIYNNDIRLVETENIFVNNLSFDQSKNQLDIKHIDIKSPYIFAQIDKNKNLNFTKLNKNTNTTPSQNESIPMNIKVGSLDIKKGAMDFEDLTLPIHFKLSNRNINGTFSEFDTKSTKPTIIKLDGSIGQYGYMKINGDLVHNDLKSYTNLKIDFDNIALNELSGYSGKFVGRKIEDGKLTLDLKYYIEKSKLDAKNNLVISQIKLGDKIESEEAVSLPLELAIAILEDRNGIIDIKLPIKGDLDNPQFSIAPIVWQAFTNILAKAITAPFSLLGSLFGFGEDEINSVPFYFGNSDITPVQKESLDKIAQILQSRPKLAIEINPSYDAKEDLQAIQKIVFTQILKEALKEVKPEEYDKEYISYLEKSYTSFGGDFEKVKQKYTKDKEFDERLYKEELSNFLILKQVVEPKSLEDLAKQRVVNIEKYLNSNSVLKEQIVVLDNVVKVKGDEKYAKVELKLSDIKYK
ncbi:MAG: DUF748 domain-containing protein [Arcobacteraceae bacterium]|nr:DUF748 domain-containing protein [Arcobacteraceae bacterium]